jgi:hypothetical protein
VDAEDWENFRRVGGVIGIVGIVLLALDVGRRSIVLPAVGGTLVYLGLWLMWWSARKKRPAPPRDRAIST